LKTKAPLRVGEPDWSRQIFDPAVAVQVNLDGIAGVFRLPRRPFRSRAKLGEHLFWHLAEGSCRGEVSGRPCALEAGGLLWVSPGESVDFEFDGDRRNTVHRFRLRVERGGRAVRLRAPFLQVPHSPATRGWFEQLVQESFLDDAHTDGRTRGLVACLTGEMFRAAGARPDAAGDRGFDAGQRRRISAWLAEHLAESPDPAALARHLGLSHDYFTRRFRASYGRPPRRWFVEERMRLAAHQLAESDLPVAQVAAAFGFTDAYFFSRQFRQVLGRSPRHWRRNAPGAAPA
jgi:AraC-like DNA-binding protein